jgi:alkanesulfonate monooxygenase SsuD/methylene tetrahydromethanopterin reductase-like flavin-dependent oxidoreductase (luciferase family)
LIESDNQTNNAVGLALSIAAIEALLGEKGQEVTTKLADNVAVLLEPDLSKRQKATEFVKDLYDTRSRALHGELVETENEARFNARHLAAAVISGVISRRDFLRRLGESPETPEQLLKELREIRFDSGQPMGVDEYNICELWRNRTTGKKDSSL